MMMKFNYPVGATPLNQDELSGLIPAHITTQEELNAWESKNILSIQDWAFKQKDILNLAFIKLLHKQMFQQTWMWAGEFRKSDKNIGVHWSQIPIRLQELCDDAKYQIEYDTFSHDEIAIRFHQRLVLIHAFANGNGRHGRLMADLLVVQLGEPRFRWGPDNKELIHATPVRVEYIKALKFADDGDYRALLAFARS